MAEYIKAGAGLPVRPIYAWMRRFHGAIRGTMVAPQSLREEVSGSAFRNIRSCSPSIDLDLFNLVRNRSAHLPGPIFACIGRVAVEKNIEPFLNLDLPGSKVVVGDGPNTRHRRRQNPRRNSRHFRNIGVTCYRADR